MPNLTISEEDLARRIRYRLEKMPACVSCSKPIWPNHTREHGGLPRFGGIAAHRPPQCYTNYSYLEMALSQVKLGLKHEEERAWEACGRLEGLSPRGIDFETWERSFTYLARRCEFHGVRFGRVMPDGKLEGMKTCCQYLEPLASGSPSFFINTTTKFHGGRSLGSQFVAWRADSQAASPPDAGGHPDRVAIPLLGENLRPQGWTEEQWTGSQWNIQECTAHGFQFHTASWKADLCCKFGANMLGGPWGPIAIGTAHRRHLREAWGRFLRTTYLDPDTGKPEPWGEILVPMVKEADPALEHLLDEDNPDSPHEGVPDRCPECRRQEHDKGHRGKRWRYCPTCKEEGYNPDAEKAGIEVVPAPQDPEFARILIEEDHIEGGHRAVYFAACPMCRAESVVTRDGRTMPRHEWEREQLDLRTQEDKQQQPMVTAGVLSNGAVERFTPVEQPELDAAKQELLDNINGNATLALDGINELGVKHSDVLARLEAIDKTVISIHGALSALGDSVRIIQIGLENDRATEKIRNMTAPKFSVNDVVWIKSSPLNSIWRNGCLVEERRTDDDDGVQHYMYRVRAVDHTVQWFDESVVLAWPYKTEEKDTVDYKYDVGAEVKSMHGPTHYGEKFIVESRKQEGSWNIYQVRHLASDDLIGFCEQNLARWTDDDAATPDYAYNLHDHVTPSGGNFNGRECVIRARTRQTDAHNGTKIRYQIRRLNGVQDSIWYDEGDLVRSPEWKFKEGDRVYWTGGVAGAFYTIKTVGTDAKSPTYYVVRDLEVGGRWAAEANLTPLEDDPSYKFELGAFVKSGATAHWREQKLEVIKREVNPRGRKIYQVRRVLQGDTTHYLEEGLSPYYPEDYEYDIHDVVLVRDPNSAWAGLECEVVGRGMRRAHGQISHMHYLLRHPESGKDEDFSPDQLTQVPCKQDTTGDPQETEVEKETPIVFKTYFCTAYNTQTGKIYEEGKVVTAKSKDGAKLKIAVKLKLPEKVDIEDVTISAIEQSPN